MRDRFKIKVARLAYGAEDDILAVVLAERHVRVRDVRDLGEEPVQARLYLVHRLVQHLDARVDLAHLRLARLACGILLHPPNLLRGNVALVPQRLELGQCRPALPVRLQETVDHRDVRAAPPQGISHQVGLFTDHVQVDHTATPFNG